jgi:methylated-DNA-protein-cysteine methyltransferase-like protein
MKKDSAVRPTAPVKSHHFFVDVFDVVKQIPTGRVTSYGAIARFLGTKMSARMVGWAMNASHSQSDSIPAHRVVNRNGMLTGKAHFSTPTRMEEQLKAEGIEIKSDTIVNFEKLFWDPNIELGL